MQLVAKLKSNTIKNTKGMIELYLTKVTENSESEQAGKLYARVSYKQTMDLHDMAHHMAEHNTAFSEGLIVGVLTDFVKCVREMVLNGNTVKVGNLAIFKATVEANALEALYDAQLDKVASATIGVLAEGAKTGPAVKTVKLLAQSTGDFTREELKKDVKLGWTDKAKEQIAIAKGENPTNASGSGTSTGGNQNQGSKGAVGTAHDPGIGKILLLASCIMHIDMEVSHHINSHSRIFPEHTQDIPAENKDDSSRGAQMHRRRLRHVPLRQRLRRGSGLSAHWL